MSRNLLTLLIILFSILLFSCQEGDPTPTEITIIDPEEPQVSIISPVEDELIINWAVIRIEATDNKGITKVEVYIDNNLHSTLLHPPYMVNWSIPRDQEPSLHTIYAKAYDADDNVNSSPIITVRTAAVNTPKDLQLIDWASESIMLSWESTAEFKDGYIVEYSTEEDFFVLDSVVTQDTTAIIGNLNLEETYRFRIREFYQNKYSDYSNIISVQYGFDSNLLLNIFPTNQNKYIKTQIIPFTNKLATLSESSTEIEIYDIISGDKIESYSNNFDGDIKKFTISPDGEYLSQYVVGDSSRILVSNLSSKSILFYKSFERNLANFNDSFSSDGGYYAFSSEFENIGFQVYSTSDWSEFYSISASTLACNFSQSDYRLFFAYDRTIRSLNLNSLEFDVLGQIMSSSDNPTQFYYSKKHSKLFVSTRLGSIYNQNAYGSLIEWQTDHNLFTVPMAFLGDDYIVFPQSGVLRFYEIDSIKHLGYSWLEEVNFVDINCTDNQKYLAITKEWSVGIYEVIRKWVRS